MSKFLFTVNQFNVIIKQTGKKQPYIGFYHLIDGIPFTGKKYQKFKSQRLYRIQILDQSIGELTRLFYHMEEDR